jgi:hypothetical protein
MVREKMPAARQHRTTPIKRLVVLAFLLGQIVYSSFHVELVIRKETGPGAAGATNAWGC